MKITDYQVAGPNSLLVRFHSNDTLMGRRNPTRTLLRPGTPLPSNVQLSKERLKGLLAEGAICRLGDSSPMRRSQVEGPVLPERLEDFGGSAAQDGALKQLQAEQAKLEAEQADKKGEKSVFTGVGEGMPAVELEHEDEDPAAEEDAE